MDKPINKQYEYKIRAKGVKEYKTLEGTVSAPNELFAKQTIHRRYKQYTILDLNIKRIIKILQ